MAKKKKVKTKVHAAISAWHDLEPSAMQWKLFEDTEFLTESRRQEYTPVEDYLEEENNNDEAGVP